MSDPLSPMYQSSERLSDAPLAVNNCGIDRIRGVGAGSRRPKGRIDYHILYIERGVCRLNTDGEEISVGAGHIIFFRPHVPQIYRFLPEDDSVSHYVHFSGRECDALLTRLGILDTFVSDIGISARYEEVSAEMVREYREGKPHADILAAAHLLELLGIIGRRLSLGKHEASDPRIEIACRILCANLSTPPSIAEMARHFRLSESRFSHLFSAAKGTSYQTFLLRARLGQAKELLEEEDAPISEISARVGYEDQNYFSRIFKKNFGVSPTHYRNNHIVKCK